MLNTEEYSLDEARDVAWLSESGSIVLELSVEGVAGRIDRQFFEYPSEHETHRKITAVLGNLEADRVYELTEEQLNQILAP